MRHLPLLIALLSVVYLQPLLAKSSTQAAMKIVALSPHAVELLYAIGAGDRIVGTLEYADYPEAALDIPRIGNFTGIQIEKVLELQPDLIIAWKSGNKRSDLEKLQSLGLNIFYSQPKNIDQISSELIKLGKLTGLTRNAELAAKAVTEKYQQIKQLYKNKQPIRVFYQLWHDPIRTIGADNWNESLINDCNGVNVFNDADSGYPVVSLENVLIKDPQVIIIPHHSGREDEKKSIWSKWQNISAVKNNKIFTIDGDLLHRFSPRALKGLAQLCRAIDSARK